MSFNIDVGPIKKIIIKHDNKGLGTGWYLEEVCRRIYCPVTSATDDKNLFYAIAKNF